MTDVATHLREGDVLGVAQDVLAGVMGTAHPDCDRALALLARGVVGLGRSESKQKRKLANVGEHIIGLADKNKGLRLDVKRLEDLLVWIYRKDPPIRMIRETLDHKIRTRINREREVGGL